MLNRAKNWMNVGKPKNQHSLENLKYLYGILNKNQSVNDNNKDLLIETLRSISEILIWGDQNDGSVFDFFLEKQMITFFLRYMKQKHGRYICVQLLQTLNILFENISNQTSLYYLLSNNHINNIIMHKFDFTDEEVMAYYISFLKTLSLKLNNNSIHFFYNERTNEFPLYVEAIKFFDHPEGMVRIAVRTITLNIYQVPVKSMLDYILKMTATHYYANLIWFLRNLVLDLDNFISDKNDLTNKSKVTDLMEEFVDQLNYIQDIFELKIETFNDVLQDELMKRFLIPICMTSIGNINNKHNTNIKPILAIFILSKVITAISYNAIIKEILTITFSENEVIVCPTHGNSLKQYLVAPMSLTSALCIPSDSNDSLVGDSASKDSKINTETNKDKIINENDINITDDEKYLNKIVNYNIGSSSMGLIEILLWYTDIAENDCLCLLSLCLMYAFKTNYKSFLETLKNENGLLCKILLKKLIDILLVATESESRIRLITLELCVDLLMSLYSTSKEYFLDYNYVGIEEANEKIVSILQTYFKKDEIFLDAFEHEYEKLQTSSINLEYLLRDYSILFKPTRTPLSGIEFSQRFPCGETEKIKFTLQMFFMLRRMYLIIRNEKETQLPLNIVNRLVKENDSLDLNSSDLIACTINTKDRKERRFMVIDSAQFILVEPEVKRIGWGVVKFANFIENVRVNHDKEDSRSLHIKVQSPNAIGDHFDFIINAKFTFDDHIRCMAAKQHLIRTRERLRKAKLEKIHQILFATKQSNNLDKTMLPNDNAASNN